VWAKLTATDWRFSSMYLEAIAGMLSVSMTGCRNGRQNAAMILAGDIGGTKTLLALFSDQDSTQVHVPLHEETFPSARYASLDEIVRAFLTQVGQDAGPINAACFGVAGPVIGTRARITNLPWEIDANTLSTALGGARVRLINDLEAIGTAVPALTTDDLHTLNEGEPVSGGTLAVIAPGTGLGEAFLIWSGNGYRAYASEGGHASFAPTNEREMDLLRELLRHYEHVSYERICSGSGMPNLYAALRDSGQAPETPDVAEQLATADDQTPIIMNAALDTAAPCPLCTLTLETFVSILGAEAGNLALKVLATGGVYLGGGIPPRIVPALQHERFLRAFQHKGRFAGLLSRVPVHIILHSRPALLGAALYAFET
jgi:glucokinase